MKTYKISFYLDKPNWVNASNIDNKTFYDFIDYLYQLDRDINVLPYIPGGGGPLCCDPTTNKTYLVEDIASCIKEKIPFELIFNKAFPGRLVKCDNFTNPYNAFVFFIEDTYELISNLCSKDAALNTCLKQYSAKEIRNLKTTQPEDQTKLNLFADWIEEGYFPYISRWNFIYMFRNEFKKFMYDKGYTIKVEGGWVLNDKEREVKLGLINEEGELY